MTLVLAGPLGEQGRRLAAQPCARAERQGLR